MILGLLRDALSPLARVATAGDGADALLKAVEDTPDLLVSDFRMAVGRLWWRVLKRRSQKARVSRAQMERRMARWVPQTHVCHPYPWQRFGVIT